MPKKDKALFLVGGVAAAGLVYFLLGRRAEAGVQTERADCLVELSADQGLVDVDEMLGKYGDVPCLHLLLDYVHNYQSRGYSMLVYAGKMSADQAAFALDTDLRKVRLALDTAGGDLPKIVLPPNWVARFTVAPVPGATKAQVMSLLQETVDVQFPEELGEYITFYASDNEPFEFPKHEPLPFLTNARVVTVQILTEAQKEELRDRVANETSGLGALGHFLMT